MLTYDIIIDNCTEKLIDNLIQIVGTNERVGLTNSVCVVRADEGED